MAQVTNGTLTTCDACISEGEFRKMLYKIITTRKQKKSVYVSG